MKTLLIRINKSNITFIDLYKNGSDLPIKSFICQNQTDVDCALRQINDMNIMYQIVFKYI